MTGLEIVGASALYVIGVIVLAYLGLGIVAFLKRKSGLEGLAAMAIWFFLIIIVGAIVGVFLLGRALA